MALLLTEQQFQDLQSINNAHNDRRIYARKSINGNWIVNEDLLTDCNNPGDTWYDWKDWLLSLQLTDETPAPKPPRPSPKPRPKQE